MTVAPGGTKSNLGNSSSAKYDQIRDWKYYGQYEAPLRARTNVSQGPGATPAEELADKVVASCIGSYLEEPSSLCSLRPVQHYPIHAVLRTNMG
jgi:hypothetical protein